MIFGDCPYCGESVTNCLAEGVSLPIFTKERCERCKNEYWLKHSRIDPEAYKLEDLNLKLINRGNEQRPLPNKELYENL